MMTTVEFDRVKYTECPFITHGHRFACGSCPVCRKMKGKYNVNCIGCGRNRGGGWVSDDRIYFPMCGACFPMQFDEGAKLTAVFDNHAFTMDQLKRLFSS